MYHPSRGGVRGGTDQFSWDSVKTDKHRENYLGHSLMAPVGRWQKGKDLSWYAKERKNDDGTKSAADNEKAAIKKAEEEAMMVALGFREPKKEGKTLVKEEIAEVLKRSNHAEMDVDRVGGLGLENSRAASVMGAKSEKNADGVLFESKDVGERKHNSTEVRDSTRKSVKNLGKASKKHKKEKKHKKKKKHNKKHKKASSSSSDSEDEESCRSRHFDEKDHSKKRTPRRETRNPNDSSNSENEYDGDGKQTAKGSSTKHKRMGIDTYVKDKKFKAKKSNHSRSKKRSHSCSSDDFSDEGICEKRKDTKRKHQNHYSDAIRRQKEPTESAFQVRRKRHDSSESSNSG